jgi:hypothetical protein
MRGILRLVSKIENKSGLLRFERILPRITNDSLNHSVTLPDQKIRIQTNNTKKKAQMPASCNRLFDMLGFLNPKEAPLRERVKARAFWAVIFAV